MTLEIESIRFHCQTLLLSGLLRSCEILPIAHGDSGLCEGTGLQGQHPQENGQTSAASALAPRPEFGPFPRSCMESPALSDLQSRAVKLEGLIEFELYAEESGL